MPQLNWAIKTSIFSLQQWQFLLPLFTGHATSKQTMDFDLVMATKYGHKVGNGLWPGHGHKVGNGLWPGHGHKVGNGFWSVMANQQSDLATWPWLCTWLQVFDEEAEATLPSNSVVYWLVLSQCYGFVQENMTRWDQYSVCGRRPISTWESLKTFTVSCFKEETVQAASKAQS